MQTRAQMRIGDWILSRINFALDQQSNYRDHAEQPALRDVNRNIVTLWSTPLRLLGSDLDFALGLHES